MTDPDLVNHPPHYGAHPSGVECIAIVEHMTFNLGNAVKYIWRAGLKSDSPVQDLEKAGWYLERELARISPSHCPRECSEGHTYRPLCQLVSVPPSGDTS